MNRAARADNASGRATARRQAKTLNHGRGRSHQRIDARPAASRPSTAMPATATCPRAAGTASPLGLLFRAHGLTMWRKLKSLGRQSRLLSSVIAVFIASYLLIAFWLFRYGLKFLDKFPPLGTLLTERLLYLLFFFLFVLLLLSNLVVSYSNLF